MKENIVLEKSVQFAVSLIEFCEGLEKQGKHVIARQLLRSGTSIGANLHEAQNAESRADFVHKIKVAAKEVEESRYWMKVCKRADSYPFSEELNNQLREIGLIVFKILSSLKR
jgi:four helix bundle protein